MIGDLSGVQIRISKWLPNLVDHVDKVPVPRRGLSKRVTVYKPPYYMMGDTLLTNPWGERMLQDAVKGQK